MKHMNDIRAAFRELGRLGGVAGFGLAIVTPLVVCIVFAVLLRERYGLGEWVIVTAIFVGLISSFCGAYRRTRAFLAEEKRRDSARREPLMPRRDTAEEWHVYDIDNNEGRKE